VSDRLEEEQQELTDGRTRSNRHDLRENRCGQGWRRGRRQTAKKTTVVKSSDKARANEQKRHLGLQNHGDEETDYSERPLQPVVHSKLRQPVAGMEYECDDSRADPVKHSRHGGKVAEMDVERTESGDDDEIGKDEGPATGPGAPKAGAQVEM
jgi:hypothetical protein